MKKVQFLGQILGIKNSMGLNILKFPEFEITFLLVGPFVCLSSSRGVVCNSIGAAV